MDEPTVDIVIVNWNSGHYLADCLASIEHLQPQGYRIASVSVIDNASRDESADVAAPTLPLAIVRNRCNTGFAAACNRGARLGRADLILFLNPDTRLTAQSLAGAIPHFTASEDVWVTGIRLVDEHGDVQRGCCRIPTAARYVARAIGVDRLLPSLGYVMTDWPHDTTRAVDHVIGAFYLIRRNAFERLGGFDERFFVYQEDLDLSLRVQASGGRCLYVSEADAYHAGGGTTRSIRSTRLFYAARSRLQFARKHFGPAGIVAVWAASLTIEPLVRTGAALWHRSANEMAEAWRAYIQLIRWLLR